MLDADLVRVKDLLQAGTDSVQAAILNAYERGVADGRRIASEQLKERLALVLNDEPTLPSDKVAPHDPLVEIPLTSPSPPTRAARGSVEPIVFGSLPATGQGKRPAEIAAETGLPENSVRGKLNKLRHAGRVKKSGEYWTKLPAPASAGNGNPGSGEPGNVQPSKLEEDKRDAAHRPEKSVI